MTLKTEVMTAENQFCITGTNYTLKIETFIIVFHNINVFFTQFIIKYMQSW